MELKVLAIITMLIGASLGQSISCSYSNITISGNVLYTCTLNINNPTGCDTFTSIDGTHLTGRTDADVRAVIVTRPSMSTNFPRILCSQFTNLVHVDFSFTNTESICDNALDQCANLEWLRLSNNRIQSVPERTFSNNTNLRHLDLGSNNIRQLPGNVFSTLSQLQTLRLSNNQFGNFPNGVFTSLVNLRELMLAQAGLNEYRTEWFSTLGNLELLILSDNVINQLPTNAFDNLSNLLILDISSNPLRVLGNSLGQLVNLRELYMSNLLITDLNPVWFENLQRLEILHVHSNRFTLLPSNVFESLNSLRVLDISNNSLTEETIPSSLFNSLTNLVQLTAARNLIRNLNPQWFQNLQQLRFLSLNFNQISALPRGIFSSITNLEQINLQENNLMTISSESFGNLRYLMFADFDTNSINSIDGRFLAETPSLNFLNILENICVNSRFPGFASNRGNFMARLENCMMNYQVTNEVLTVASEEFEFFPAVNPGIRFHVTGIYRSAHIALVSEQNPLDLMVVRIGSLNNTATRVFRGEELVQLVSTPGILIEDQWNGFSLTWSNNVITVTGEGDRLPFVSIAIDTDFSVVSYGLRNNHPAIWNILPIDDRNLASEE